METTRRPITQTVNVLRQEGPSLKHRQKNLRVPRQQEQTLVQKFKPPPSKVDKTRTIVLRHVEDRGESKKKNRGWRGDVKPDTLKKILDEFPTDFLKIMTHLSVSLTSSIQLSIPIRSRLTLTTCSYRYSHSLTLEHSSSRLSRSEGEGRNGWEGSVDCSSSGPTLFLSRPPATQRKK
jgi:hypothetical protein